MEDTDIYLESTSTEEVLEWFNGIQWSAYIVRELNKEYIEPEFQVSEYHVWTIVCNKAYMGNFIIGGMLRKEGRVFKRIRTRWIEVRSVGVYYYKARGDRNAKGSILLKGCEVKATSKYREHFHIAITN